MATVKEIEKKLGPLAQLHELSQSTEERLSAINALAEHVSHKPKRFENSAARSSTPWSRPIAVNEMVWAMDVAVSASSTRD